MVDPHDIIYFFKSEVQVSVQEQYQDVCEQIKFLKENHIFHKDALEGPSACFNSLAALLK